MPKEMDLIKANTIKRYIVDVLKMRVSATAADTIRARFNELLKHVIMDSSDLAKKDKRSTIAPRDVYASIEKNIGSKNLPWDELLDHMKKLNAIELGSFAKGIQEYVKQLKDAKE